ncbi:VP22 [Thermus phage P23-77]|uniref:VP22 n=1 Tax=Thermus virus P23-77 TaxID=1714272 RepID=C8CHM0_9VIRU|nr:VP22 [Thermus phage P23-77]ACV05049.1 VP22 [Thermus phage P23-77]
MDGKTLLLVLLGGGVAAYLAYSLAKRAPASPSSGGGTGDAGQTPPAVVDYGDAGAGLGFGLGNLGQDALCRVAPSLCSWWWNPAPQPAPTLW